MGENTFIDNLTIFDEAGLDITTNLSPKATLSQGYLFSDYATLGSIEPIGVFVDLKSNVGLKIDKKDPYNFIKYGNGSFLVESTIGDIILRYPKSLFSSTLLNNTSISGYNVINAGYNPLSNTTVFTLLTNYIKNPLGLYCGKEQMEGGLVTNLSSYVVETNGAQYEIISLTPSTGDMNSTIGVTVSGQCFLSNGNLAISLYIRPRESVFTEFYNSLTPFGAYLLEKPFRFYDVEEGVGGVLLNYTLALEFPRSDLYNLDVTSEKYENFLTALLGFFSKHDDRYDVILREYVPDSLKTLTLEDSNGNSNSFGKLNQMFLVWGDEFDKLHQKIRNLKFLNTLEGVPNEYVGLFFKKLGFSIDATNLEDWKPLLVNLSYLWKSKTTTSVVEFLLDYFGIPMEIVDFYQYEYLVNNIDYAYLESIYAGISPSLGLSDLPVNPDGSLDLSKLKYPTLKSSIKSLENLIPPLESYEVKTSVDKQYYKTLYKNPNGVTEYYLLDKFLNVSACFEATGYTTSDPYPNTTLDECGCPLPVADNVFKVENTSIDTYLYGCTNFVLDVVPQLHITSTTITVTGETTIYLPSECDGLGGCPEITITYTISYLDELGSIGEYKAEVSIVDVVDGGVFEATIVAEDYSQSFVHTGLADLHFSVDFSPSPVGDIIFLVTVTYTTPCNCNYSGESIFFIEKRLHPTVTRIFELSSYTEFEETSGTPMTTITSSTTTEYGCYWGFEFNTYGGQSPFTYVGLQPSGMTESGETYQVYAVDANGCYSNTVSGVTVCPDLCDIFIDIGYECISGTTTAELSIFVSGGTAPYEYVGASNGDIVNHGETIAFKVIDANGCESFPTSITIDCNPMDVDCLPLGFNSALVTTSVLEDNSSIVTMSYEVVNLPFSVYVDNIETTAVGVGISNNYLVGTPVMQDFSTDFGSKQYLFDFDPESPGIITMSFDVTITLTNGCIYFTQYTLSVDASILSSTDEIQLILE